MILRSDGHLEATPSVEFGSRCTGVCSRRMQLRFIRSSVAAGRARRSGSRRRDRRQLARATSDSQEPTRRRSMGRLALPSSARLPDRQHPHSSRRCPWTAQARLRPKSSLEVAPDAVDVRALVARVVELEQERRALQAVVLRLARLERARPSRSGAARSRRGRSARGCARATSAGSTARVVSTISVTRRRCAARRGRRRGRRPARAASTCGRVLRHVVGEALVLEDRDPLLPRAERADERARRVLLARHRPVAARQARVRARRAGRPRAEEVRVDRDAVADDGEVPREVVPLEPPAPGPRAAGVAEDRDVVALGVERASRRRTPAARTPCSFTMSSDFR